MIEKIFLTILKQLRNHPDVFTNQSYVLLRDLKSPKNYNDAYFKRISEIPDKKFYLNLDLLPVNDLEMHESILYPFSWKGKFWTTSAIDKIKFEMPNRPPLYNLDQIDKVISTT